jgi:hypothetical protein
MRRALRLAKTLAVVSGKIFCAGFFAHYGIRAAQRTESLCAVQAKFYEAGSRGFLTGHRELCRKTRRRMSFLAGFVVEVQRQFVAYKVCERQGLLGQNIRNSSS